MNVPSRASGGLPPALIRDIERAGYYPGLVRDVVSTALAGDDVVSHLVHQETTFDHDSVRRHVTVLVLTGITGRKDLERFPYRPNLVVESAAALRKML